MFEDYDIFQYFKMKWHTKYVHYFMVQSILNLKIILYIIYIVPTLHVVKEYSWNLYILKIQMH
jgi:hypothetical protein